MTFTPEQTLALQAPLSKSNVKKNPKGFDYVEAWHAISEANRIFGHDGWTRETVMLTETNRDLVDLKGSNGPYQQWRVGYIAKVKIMAGDTVREGTGFGSGMSKPEALGDAIESAVKEAESDAMKRALMTFGNPFGLALYDKAQANVTSAKPAPQVEGVMTGRQLQEAQDRPEYDPEPPLGSNRLSSFEANRQGLGESIKKFIDGAKAKELDLWEKNFDRNTAHLPASWLEPLRDRIQLRREELTGEASVAEDAEGLDEAFRQTMGSGSAAGLSGRNGSQAAA